MNGHSLLAATGITGSGATSGVRRGVPRVHADGQQPSRWESRGVQARLKATWRSKWRRGFARSAAKATFSPTSAMRANTAVPPFRRSGPRLRVSNDASTPDDRAPTRSAPDSLGGWRHANPAPDREICTLPGFLPQPYTHQVCRALVIFGRPPGSSEGDGIAGQGRRGDCAPSPPGHRRDKPGFPAAAATGLPGCHRGYS
jgi:hypothetical protein